MFPQLKDYGSYQSIDKTYEGHYPEITLISTLHQLVNKDSCLYKDKSN